EWRGMNMPAQVSAWFEAYPNVGRFGDQDPLNVILEGRIRDLSPRWNMTSSLMEAILYKGQTGRNFREDMEQAAIIHFAGGRKPWHPDFTGPFAQQFLQCLARTPWGPDALPRRTWATHLARIRSHALQFARRLKSLLRRKQAYPTEAHYDA
ncbi:MAG: glycosyltransferase family 8 protein, partial [Hyphomicrobiales bacterium]|nr:glycosyltransferase family 8 protein [Hyphomicrobiales bacterium]